MVDYLGRYTHRIALSDGRLVDMDEHHVSFTYRDYRDNQKKRMTLKGTEFVRRFLQHVLPKGLMRVRHFGWLANASHGKTLPKVRAAIISNHEEQSPQIPEKSSVPKHFEGIPCPCCKQSLMKVYAVRLSPTRHLSICLRLIDKMLKRYA